MSTFTIDTGNNIAAHAEVPAGSENIQAFASEKELAKVAAERPGSRLAEIWNSFAGVAPFTELKPVKKFTDRKAAVARIWAALQRLLANAVPQASDVASAKESAKKASASGHRDDKAREGRYARGDHGSNGLAGAHRPRVREHPRQQGRGGGRILEEHRRRAHLSGRQVALKGTAASKRRLRLRPRRRSCFHGRRLAE